jgi:hypothetical protein
LRSGKSERLMPEHADIRDPAPAITDPAAIARFKKLRRLIIISHLLDKFVESFMG